MKLKATTKQKARAALALSFIATGMAFSAIGYGIAPAFAEANRPKPLPVIVKRECSAADANRVKTCTITYEGGMTAIVKMKDGVVVEGEAN